MYFLYILKCSDNSLYTGITTDLKRRVKEHNGDLPGGAKYTKGRGPVKILYFEKAGDRSLATKKEKEVKNLTRKKKEELIKNFIKIMNNIDLSKHYFKLSNESSLSEIRNLFKENSTYSSPNTGLYLGVDNIIDMQSKFHGSFENLNWDIDSIEEINPGIVFIEFTFSGVKKTGEKINFSGKEFLVIFDGRIQHIEIK